ncbi:ester cyclase [Modestobacter altitudinis]|uniref:ester cyclase n=1 Tax=Modestobacter altitudinis TaxID=2213158 RepID=UPI001FEBCB4F|nr:ester cyclase [Modestobacter altitudinis]
MSGPRGLVADGEAEQHGAMAFDVDRLLRLWTELPADDAVAAAAFRELYTDPVTVNGAPVALTGLVVRARALQAALDRVEREVVDVVEGGGGKVAVAFRLRGRHTGTLSTSAGPVPATGEVVELRVIDVLTLTDGRISEIWMVADELGALVGTGAVRVVPVVAGGG